VIGRRKGKKVQIAFGHHRVKAAERLYGLKGIIPIIVKPLSDDMMRKMMVRENKEEWGCLPAAIDDAIKAARDHLEGHRDDIKKALSSVRPAFKRVRVGAPAIAKYTGYSQSTVELSLQRLGWIEAGEVDREALHKMPNQTAARRFTKAVLLAKLPVGDQKKAAEKVVKDGKFGLATIEQTIREFVPMLRMTDPCHSGYYENQLMKATRQINGAVRTLASFDRLNDMTVFGNGPTDEDIADLVKRRFNEAVEELAHQVKIIGEKLDRNPEHGKAMFPELEEEDKK